MGFTRSRLLLLLIAVGSCDGWSVRSGIADSQMVAAQSESPTAGDTTAARTRTIISYHLAREGRISLAVYDSTGTLVRELLRGANRRKGRHTEIWDGRDGQGEWVPSGRYTWRMLSTQGLEAEYLLTLGTNPAPRWESWPGNHNGVAAVAVDGTGTYLAAGLSEGGPTIIKQNSAGKRLWEVSEWLEPWQGGHALANNGSSIYMLQGNGKIQVLEASSGRHKATWDVIWQEADRNHTPHLGASPILDLDARGDQLVVSYANHNAVRWLDPNTGRTVREVSVREPLGVAFNLDGSILVISQGKVVSLDRSGRRRPIVGGAVLASPWRLTVDPLTGDILVAERAGTQQVKRFSSAGKLLRSYGTPGGRPPEGRYDPMGFNNINDIAADGRGGFLVAEPYTAPRRTGHFDKDGKLVREWYGGQMYANFAVVDPSDPSLVWLNSHWGSLIQAKVDYNSKTWQVLATYTFGGLAEGLVPGHMHEGGQWFVRRHKGHTYLLREGTPAVLLVDEPNRRLVPLVVGAFNVPHYWNGQPSVVKQWFGSSSSSKHSYLWTDAAGKGRPTDDDVRLFEWTSWFVGGYPDPSFDYYFLDRYNGQVVWRLPVQEWTRSGTPIYGDLNKMEVAARVPDSFSDIQPHGGVWRGGDGSLFAAVNSRMNPGSTTSAMNLRDDRVLKWDETGKFRWAVGNKAAGTQIKPGESSYLWRIIGTAHGSVLVGDRDKSMVHVWDRDGLWVGRLLDHPNTRVAPRQAYELGSENFNGFAYTSATGEVLFFGSGQNSTPVYRITGWDEFERQSGTIKR